MPRKSWYSYCIVWKDKNGEQIFDVVDHYSYDEALKVIYLDDNWTDGVSEIVCINIYPLTKSQMRERKKLTGIEVT